MTPISEPDDSKITAQSPRSISFPSKSAKGRSRIWKIFGKLLSPRRRRADREHTTPPHSTRSNTFDKPLPPLPSPVNQWATGFHGQVARLFDKRTMGDAGKSLQSTNPLGRSTRPSRRDAVKSSPPANHFDKSVRRDDGKPLQSNNPLYRSIRRDAAKSSPSANHSDKRVRRDTDKALPTTYPSQRVIASRNRSGAHTSACDAEASQPFGVAANNMNVGTMHIVNAGGNVIMTAPNSPNSDQQGEGPAHLPHSTI